MRHYHFILRLLLVTLLFTGVSNVANGKSKPRKREFRGAWIQCVNGQFQGMGTREMQRTLAYQLGSMPSSFRCDQSVMHSIKVSWNHGVSSLLVGKE